MTQEIPYSKLSLVGITKEMLDRMPEVKQRLMNGELTPLISVNKRTENGAVVQMPMKLRMEEGNIIVYPMNAEMRNSVNVGPATFNDIVRGDVVHVNGRYMQRDPETNCILVMTEKQLDIERKLAELEKVKDIELGVEQRNQIKEGKPVELNVGDEKVTVGLDLRDKDHFRTLNGDMEDWKRQQEITYDILHPEYIGIVQTDENRWEYQKIKTEGLGTQSVKEKPMMAQTSSMKR